MMEGDTAGGDNVFSLLYPLNKSLAEEIERLFSKWSFSLESPCYGTAEDDVMREFRLNGQDSEYCPEFMPTNKSLCMSTFLESNRMIDLATGFTSTAPTTRSKKRTKRLIQECVFCKNNGEQEMYYKQHVLKDSAGRVVCPVLRAYTCPICNAKGDDAHTIKYCPKNNNPEVVATMTVLKAHRTATGLRGNKRISSA